MYGTRKGRVRHVRANNMAQQLCNHLSFYLVSVLLWLFDVVLHALWVERPHGADDVPDIVAEVFPTCSNLSLRFTWMSDGFANHTKGNKVLNIIDSPVGLLDLLPDRERLLHAASDIYTLNVIHENDILQQRL